MVVREAEGERVVQSMTWGFPVRLQQHEARLQA
jgi:hypothetical protein